MASPERQLTVRAIATGFALGALLAPCNIYAGLKTGFSVNMSIAAALISYAFWNGLHHFGLAKRWGLLENNINQTAASSGGNILSAGLVAPIPALALVTGMELSYPMLVAWVFVVSFGGIVCALAIRRQMLDRDALPFPVGVATAETIKEIYAHGKEAAYRIKLLFNAALVAFVVKLVDAFWWKIPYLTLPAKWGFKAPTHVADEGLKHISWASLGVSFQPSLMYLGFGAIVGPRVGVTLLIGTIIGWMYLPKLLLEKRWTEAALDGNWYGAITDWSLWPGVSLMVAAALMSFAISMFKIIKRNTSANEPSEAETSPEYEPGGERYFPKSWFIIGIVIALILSVIAQQAIFNIPIWLGTVAFALSFVLAIVAGRVSGETGIPPIGALGKITQVTFGFLAPVSEKVNLVAANTINLMAANVTGGAAGQCSDMLHDLKTGKLVGANMKAQVVAQVFGVLSGSFAGCGAYQILINDPQKQLLTEDWPAPAVAIWKSVAEVMAQGLGAIPEGVQGAVIISVILGALLAILESVLPEKRRGLVPSASALGFALIIPPAISLTMFVGSMLRVGAEKINKHWATKYIVVIAAGLVAGESIGGLVDAISKLLMGL